MHPFIKFSKFHFFSNRRIPDEATSEFKKGHCRHVNPFFDLGTFNFRLPNGSRKQNCRTKVAVPWLEPPLYFLDKLCVHQTDAELKLAGVASLAAFIASSEHMLLLWTPKYFESMWCMLEFCAVVRSHGPSPCDIQKGPSLDFLPMQLSKLSFFIWLTLGLGLFTVPELFA